VNGMNEVKKSFIITLGFFILLSFCSLGWNFYQQKQKEAYCEKLKQLRSKVENLPVSTTTLQVEEGLHNCQ
jgi:predicted negative regulator of RcsB-dependent stress response